MSAPILVTGATGFLGGRLARALLERGEELRLLHRPGRRSALASAMPEGAEERAEAVEGDVTDAASVQAALEGCRAVLHAAARVSRAGSRADFDAANVGGLENVLAAARAVPGCRVVYTSSFFALGASPPGQARGESALDEPAGPELDHYQASKAVAARVALAATRAGEPVATVVPGAIVGPGPLTEGNFVSTLVRDHLIGRLVPLPLGGRPRWSFVHVDDVAELHLRVLGAEDPPPVLCAGGTNAGLREVFAEVQRLTARRAPRWSVPGSGLWLAGAGEEALQVLFGRPPTQLTRGAARLLQRDWAVDSSRARQSLGWEPRGLESLLRDTLGWLVRSGEVPPLELLGAPT